MVDETELEGYFLEYNDLPVLQAGCSLSFGLEANIVFTDGSCSGQASGYGIYMGMEHPLNRCVQLSGPHSSGRAEVQALIQALLNLLQWKNRPNKEINIYTDCLFAIKGMHHVRAKRNGKKPPPVETIPAFREKFLKFMETFDEELLVLLLLAQQFESAVRINFIKGHTGEAGNERADLYAAIGRVGSVNSAERLKSFQKSVPQSIAMLIRNRPYIVIEPSQAARNLSKLTLNTADRNNEILYPPQQIIWNPQHWMSEYEIGKDLDSAPF